MEDDKRVKKLYEKPQIRIVEVGAQELLVAASPDPKLKKKPKK